MMKAGSDPPPLHHGEEKKKTNSSLRQLSYKRPPVRRITLQRDITFDRATSS